MGLHAAISARTALAWMRVSVLGLLLLALFAFFAPSPSPAAAVASGETLIWVEWGADIGNDQDASRLVTTLRELPADLLAHNEEGLLVRAAMDREDLLDEATSATGARSFVLDAAPDEDLYLLFHSAGAPIEEAVAAHFEEARLLHDGIRVAVLAVRAGERIGACGGDAAMVRVTPYAKPWDAALSSLAPRDVVLPPVVGAPFDPLIDQMIPLLTPVNYHNTLVDLVASFPTRYTYSVWCDSAAQHVLEWFLALGLDAELHHYTASGPRVQVIATLPGLENPDEVVYLSAHLDDTSELRYDDAPGADDDGSGTVAVMEAARVLRNFSFSRTIKFATFTGEEQGLLGSGEYVQDIFAAGENVVADFQMDMIGWSGSDPVPHDLVIYTNTASQALALRWEDAILEYMPTGIEPVVTVDALGASDHASFWDYGYQAVLGIEDEAWGDDFNPHYHTSSDDIQYIDFTYATLVARSALAVAADYAIPLARTSVADAAGTPADAGLRDTGLSVLSLSPNPMRGVDDAAALRFALRETAPVTVGVFDLSGRRVRTLLDETLSSGVHRVSWDGRDAGGRPAASGLYFLRLAAGAAGETERLLLVR